MSFDVYTTIKDIVKNPAKYQLTNVKDSCYGAEGVCENPDQYLFWDHLHPTGKVHKMFAQMVYEQLKALN